MKKPFKDTKAFQIIKKLSPLISAVPGVGPIAANILDNNSTDPGIVDNKELAPQLVSLGVLIVLAYLALTGRISWEDAEAVKDFVR